MRGAPLRSLANHARNPPLLETRLGTCTARRRRARRGPHRPSARLPGGAGRAPPVAIEPVPPDRRPAQLLSLLCGARLHRARSRTRPADPKEARSPARRARPGRALASTGRTEKGQVWMRLHAGKIERDRLLLALFAYGGLRRSELFGLDCDDVDLERRLLRVRHGKTARSGWCRSILAWYPCSSPTPPNGRKRPLRRCSWAFTAGASSPRPSQHVSPLRHCGWREQAQAHHTPHAAPRLRHGTAQLGRQPAPNPGAARPQAPGSTQRYTRVNAHQLRGAVKRLPWTQPERTATYYARLTDVRARITIGRHLSGRPALGRQLACIWGAC
jgi:integrase